MAWEYKISTIRLYLAQINATLGDIKGNYGLIASHIGQAKKAGVDMVLFPELAITGYPPEDLLLKAAFIDKNIYYLNKLKDLVTDIVAVIGFAGSAGGAIFNSAAVIHDQKIKSVYNKQFLPNYSVFDEERYFQKGSASYTYKIGDVTIGINICEDIFYASGPARTQSALGGAELIINISASPYHIKKIGEREKILSARAAGSRAKLAYINIVGGQDELVFDGNSLILDENGKVLARAKPFVEDVLIYDLDLGSISPARLEDDNFKDQRTKMQKSQKALPVVDIKYNAKEGEKPLEAKLIDEYREFISCPEEEILDALVLGTRDYIRKNGFTKIVIALSGGIDSALTVVVASLAIGNGNVTAVLMPSDFSSSGSVEDSMALSKNLGIRAMTIPISGIYNSYLKDLGPVFKDKKINITKENIQARIRGNIIMAMSNENDWLVLSTGNKSEISVGYCTLYGDMVGGFSPIKDVYKTMVYDICRFINKKYSSLIPENIMAKAPSAELKPDQKDQDRLPPYDLLDKILQSYIEDDLGYDEIVKKGFDPGTVKDIICMVNKSEYKRRQGPPGIKISPRAFGKDRRYPITNKFLPD